MASYIWTHRRIYQEEGDDLTFKTVLEQWWEGKKMSLNQNSIFKKDMTINVHILPWFGGLDLTDIDDCLINKFIRHELKEGNAKTHEPLCRNSVVKEIDIVRNVLNYSVVKGYITKNPMDLICLKKVPAKKFEVYTPVEIDKLILAARPKWLGDMILLSYRTGMRRGEIYGLQWGDIDFEQKSLHVSRSVTSYEPLNKTVKAPKTRTSNRIIMLDNNSVDMLLKRKSIKKSDTWVFPNQYGELMSPWYNVKYFRESCKRAEIPIRRFHDLRHTHITELVVEGVPVPIIQNRAGHSNIQTTMRYVHVMPTMQQVVVDILNRSSV